MKMVEPLMYKLNQARINNQTVKAKHTKQLSIWRPLRPNPNSAPAQPSPSSTILKSEYGAVAPAQPSPSSTVLKSEDGAVAPAEPSPSSSPAQHPPSPAPAQPIRTQIGVRMAQLQPWILNKKRPSRKWTIEQQEKYEQTFSDGPLAVTSEVRKRSPPKIYQMTVTN